MHLMDYVETVFIQQAAVLQTGTTYIDLLGHFTVLSDQIHLLVEEGMERVQSRLGTTQWKLWAAVIQPVALETQAVA